MDIFILWLFAQADTLSELFLGATIVTGLMAAVAIAGYTACSIDSDFKGGAPFWRKAKNTAVPVFAVFLLLNIAMPDRTGLAIIIGGKIAIEGIKTEEFQDTTRKLYDVIHQELDSRLEIPEEYEQGD